MSTNSKTIITDKKSTIYIKPKHYTIKRERITTKPIAKRTTLLSSAKSIVKDKERALPNINSQRLTSSQKTMIKIDIEVKDKRKEDNDQNPSIFSIEAKNDSNKLIEKINELETELKRLNDENNQMKNTIGSNEKKKTNLLRDIDHRDNYISMKSSKLNKLKKENVELKAKLEELKNQSKAELESSMQNDNSDGLNPVDELFYRLIASCQYGREEAEEERPLATELLSQISVLAYDNSLHSDAKKCLLCNFELCNNDIIMQIPSCLHIFHNACLVHHFQKSNICPSCSEEVKDF